MSEAPNNPSNLDLLEQRLGSTWASIHKARVDTSERRTKLDNLFRERSSPDTSLVVFGSVARHDDETLKALTMKYGVF